MGAGCSGTKVANQVDKNAIGKKTLTEQAKEHLKNMREQDPLVSPMKSEGEDTQKLGKDFFSLTALDRDGEETKVVDQDNSA